MRTINRSSLVRRARALDVWGKVSIGIDTKPRDEESRKELVLADALAISKAVDFSKFVNAKSGIPLGGRRNGRPQKVTGRMLKDN